MEICSYSPLDRESGYTRLLSQNIALDPLNNWLGRRLGVKLFRVVLVIDIVTNANEFSTIVGTGQEYDRNT